jgi:hypothetical protein
MLVSEKYMRNKEERKRKNAKWNKEEAEMRRQDVKEAKREYMRKKEERKRTKWRRQEEENEAKRKRAEATKEQPSN